MSEIFDIGCYVLYLEVVTETETAKKWTAMALSKTLIEYANDRLNEIGWGADGKLGNYKVYSLSNPEQTEETFSTMQDVYAREKELYDRQNGIVNEVKVRYQKSGHTWNIKIVSPERAVEFFRMVWDNEIIDLKEQMLVVFLDNDKNVVGYTLISTGSNTATIVDPKEVIRMALLTGCTSFIMAHNHPSGALRASTADIKLTKRIKECASLFGIGFDDHVILCGDSYFSLSEKGLV